MGYNKAKLATAMLGQACGDAFGAPFEYHKDAPRLAQESADQGRYLNTPLNKKLPHHRVPGMYTDDTQQALCLVKTRIESPEIKDARHQFWNLLLQMTQAKIPGASFGSHRGVGGNFRTLIMTGKVPVTAGIGGAMRVGPVATMFDDPQEMVDWITAMTEITTTDPVGVASAVRFAILVWAVANPERAAEMKTLRCPDSISSEAWNATVKALHVMRAEGEKGLLEYARTTGWANKEMRCAANGFGLTGMAWAIERALTASDFEDAMVRVCGSGGDTDTVGAMTGCLAALKFGVDNIPTWMRVTLHGFEGVWEPWNWDPGMEIPLTEMDVQHRRDLLVEMQKRKKEGKKARKGVQDVFDFLTESEEDPILFGSRGTEDLYKPWSNFAMRAFTLDGEEWPSVEHYYQAMKNPDDADYVESVRTAPTAWEAKKLGKGTKLRDGWDKIKRTLMAQAVRAKFDAHPDLQKALFESGTCPIHENRPDPWWGGGPNYPKGKNWLGLILENLRDFYQGGG